MKKLGKAIWVTVYTIGTLIATVLIFPMILMIAIIRTIGSIFEDNR